MKELSITTAIEALTKFGANVEKIDTNKWWVEDNGIWGLSEPEPKGMYLDEDEIKELAEEYASDYL